MSAAFVLGDGRCVVGTTTPSCTKWLLLYRSVQWEHGFGKWGNGKWGVHGFGGLGAFGLRAGLEAQGILGFL